MAAALAVALVAAAVGVAELAWLCVALGGALALLGVALVKRD